MLYLIYYNHNNYIKINGFILLMENYFLYDCFNVLFIEKEDEDHCINPDFKYNGKNFIQVKENYKQYSLQQLSEILTVYDFSMNYKTDSMACLQRPHQMKVKQLQNMISNDVNKSKFSDIYSTDYDYCDYNSVCDYPQVVPMCAPKKVKTSAFPKCHPKPIKVYESQKFNVPLVSSLEVSDKHDLPKPTDSNIEKYSDIFKKFCTKVSEIMNNETMKEEIKSFMGSLDLTGVNDQDKKEEEFSLAI